MIADRIASLFRPSSALTRPVDPYRYLNTLPLPVIAAGVHVSAEEALQLAVVWACCDAITKAISCSHWGIYELQGRKRTFLPEDDLDWLLNGRPNPEMTAIAFREALFFGGALTEGNGYAEIVRNASGKPTQLWPLLADRVVYTREPEPPWHPYYIYQQPDGSWVRLEPRDVFHLRGPSLNGYMGDVFVARAARSIGLALAQERFATAYFANGTTLGTVLEFPGKLDLPTHERLKKDWDEKRKGPDKSHKPIILEGGMKVSNIAHDAEKAQLIDQRKFAIEDICRFYGVPPHKVQHLDRATFNNIEHLGIEFTRDAVKPWALRLQQEADYKLFPLREQKPYRYTCLDTEWLAYGDAKSRAEADQIYRRIGVYSANDILERLGRNTIGKEGDVRLVEKNMTTVEGIEQEMELAAKKAETDAKVAEEKAKQPPPAPPGQAPAKEEPAVKPKTDPKEAARQAVRHAIESSLERYRRRVVNRRADLVRGGKGLAAAEMQLAPLREEWRKDVYEECDEVVDILSHVARFDPAAARSGVASAADKVDNGQAPEQAAQELIDALAPPQEAAP